MRNEKIKELKEELLRVEDEEEKKQILEDIEALINYEKGVCCLCGDVLELGELYHTNLDGCVCACCIDELRSRGEKIRVGESFYFCEDELKEMEE